MEGFGGAHLKRPSRPWWQPQEAHERASRRLALEWAKVISHSSLNNCIGIACPAQEGRADMAPERASGESSKKLLVESAASQFKIIPRGAPSPRLEPELAAEPEPVRLCRWIRNQPRTCWQQLQRAVTESINQLITLCTQQAPGQKECDNALRELEVLGEAMAGISQNAKMGDLPVFGDCVGVASKALCGLTEAAAQAAYLVGISDPNSQAGQQGLVDPIQFARANQAIQMACQNLVDPASSPSQRLPECVLEDSQASREEALLLQSVKGGVANSAVTNLVKSDPRRLDGDFSEDNRTKCRIATPPR
uniref:Talin-2 n=1 Tax=Sphaerodactylus townsendi TaxID=933632 RepID=A0ACB8E5E2_9SAUR